MEAKRLKFKLQTSISIQEYKALFGTNISIETNTLYVLIEECELPTVLTIM